MSRHLIIWLKMSTLCPPALSFGRSLSMRTSFPEAWIMALRLRLSSSTTFSFCCSWNSETILSSAPVIKYLGGRGGWGGNCLCIPRCDCLNRYLPVSPSERLSKRYGVGTPSTWNLRVIATLSQFHHCVHEVRNVRVTRAPSRQVREIPLQNCTVVLEMWEDGETNHYKMRL